MTMLDTFIAYLEEQVENGSIYVWGAQGQKGAAISEAWIRARENSAANAQRAIALWKKRVAAGYGDVLRAFDCSGLGMYYLQNLKGIYTGDMTAHSMMGKCAKIALGEVRRGDWLFRLDGKGWAYHIGYMVSDAAFVEAKGRDAGVVKRKLADAGGYWHAAGRPDAFAQWICGGEAQEPEGAFFARCAGGTVNVRTGPAKNYPIVQEGFVARRGDRLLAMRAQEGWCAVCVQLDGALKLGYMAEKYVEEVEERA